MELNECVVVYITGMLDAVTLPEVEKIAVLTVQTYTAVRYP